ncbi:MAG: peptidylprolyl isomerase [Glaciihabitans sp.]|nr:peptidylprolyl isomerase [Glaciihabitans sp.]
MNPGLSKVGVVRKFAAIVLAAAFLVSVGACSDLPAQAENCTPASTPGAASESVTAAGKFGGNPDAKVPTPIKTTRVETSIDKTGSGLLLGPDDVALVQYSIYDGSTGSLLGTTGQGGFAITKALTSTVGAKADPIGRYLSCVRTGSRAVTVETATQFLGSAAAVQQAGLASNLTLVVVSDVVRGYRGRATGVLQPVQPDFPSVVTSSNGTPGFTFDLQTAPKTLKYEVLRKGSGQKTKAGDALLLQVQAVAWTNPPATTTFDSTWTTHAPRYYPLKALQPNGDASTGATVYSLDPGSVKALTGQTVGSQILVVVPPKYGYPSGKAPAGYPTGTLVFVYDILGVLPTS